jgi:pectate lyase
MRTFLVVLASAVLANTVSAEVKNLPAFPGQKAQVRWPRAGAAARSLKSRRWMIKGRGSFRSAIDAEGARIIVFRVSGTIELKRRLKVPHGDLTIAGQTAPGDGICLKNFGLDLSDSRNVIVRYLRVRPGDGAGAALDAISGPIART